MALTNRRPAGDRTKSAQHVAQDGHVFQLPTYTMKQIHDAIPPHCFHPSTRRSMAYVARDALYFTTLLYASSYIPRLPSAYLRVLAWLVYTTLQGMIMTGIWILAHECGHGGFSKSKRLNDIMGLIMHSFLLVPYHSWRLTHARHHKATGNLDKDTAFVPHTRESWVKMRGGAEADVASVDWSEVTEDAPLVALWESLVHQLLGWPGYLLLNVTGQDHPEASGWMGWVKKSHFWFGDDSVLFKGPKETSAVALSDLGVVVMMVALYSWGQAVGSLEVMLLFVVPWLWVNCWIVAITFLQHTDPALPHYSSNTHTFLLGATATIDRDLGFIDTHFFHSIISTHVLHHLVSSIPFYNAKEATIAVRKVMGEHYCKEEKKTGMIGFWNSFWTNQRECQFVEECEGMEGSGVLFFRNLHGVGEMPRDLCGGKKETKIGNGMAKRRNSAGTKRRLSHGVVAAALPLLAE